MTSLYAYVKEVLILKHLVLNSTITKFVFKLFFMDTNLILWLCKVIFSVSLS